VDIYIVLIAFCVFPELRIVRRVAAQPRPARRADSPGGTELLGRRTTVGRVPATGRGPFWADVELGGRGSPAPEPPVYGHRSYAGRRSATVERHA